MLKGLYGVDENNEYYELVEYTIPESVTVINQYAFAYSPLLTTIIVDENNTVYDSRNNCNAIIETEYDELILGCDTTIIPYGVKDICHGAFADCKNFTHIAIPDSVTCIGDYAFAGCTNLTAEEGMQLYKILYKILAKEGEE